MSCRYWKKYLVKFNYHFSYLVEFIENEQFFFDTNFKKPFYVCLCFRKVLAVSTDKFPIVLWNYLFNTSRTGVTKKNPNLLTILKGCHDESSLKGDTVEVARELSEKCLKLMYCVQETKRLAKMLCVRCSTKLLASLTVNCWSDLTVNNLIRCVTFSFSI